MHIHCKCGALKKAREVFEQLPVRDVVSWSALIAGYIVNGLGHEALQCFIQMQDSGVLPDMVTYVSVLKGCGMVGCLEIGARIEADVRKRGGLFQEDVVLGTAMVDMYAKCGAMEKARKVFEQLPVWGTVSCTALMAGYAQLGKANVVLDLFTKMKKQGIAPNLISFLILLSACSHAGLVKDGEKLFNEMCVVYDLTPSLEHYTCMIDLFGRAGDFDKMKALLDKMPSCDHIPLYLSILGACSKWRNVKFGLWAFKQVIGLDGNCAAAYMYMESIYTGSWNANGCL